MASVNSIYAPSTPGPKGLVAPTSIQSQFTLGGWYRLNINDYPWSDGWAYKPAHRGDYLWTESYLRSKIDGILVELLNWSGPNGAPPASFQGDLGKNPYWVWAQMRTGPFSAYPWYPKLWVATHWLVDPSATCTCSMQVLWVKGCQCGKP